MRIGVAKEIKSDEYRVALTPAGARELVDARSRGHRRDRRRGRQRVPRRAVHGRRRADRLGRRGVGARRAAAEGQGADRARVRAAARRADAVHVPAHRRRRAADAGARRERRSPPWRTRRSRRTTARLPLLAPMSEVAGRLAAQAGAYFLEKPLGGRGLLLGGVPGVAPGRVVVIGGGIVGYNAAVIAHRARRPGDDPRALDRPHAPPGGDPLRPRHAADVVRAPDRGVGRRRGRRSSVRC